MKRTKFSEAQIAFILRQGEEGTPVGEVCRKAGISEATYYNWRKKYGGIMPSEMKQLRQLEEENSKLNKIVADLSLDKEMLQDVIRRKFCGRVYTDRSVPLGKYCRRSHWCSHWTHAATEPAAPLTGTVDTQADMATIEAINLRPGFSTWSQRFSALARQIFWATWQPYWYSLRFG